MSKRIAELSVFSLSVLVTASFLLSWDVTYSLGETIDHEQQLVRITDPDHNEREQDSTYPEQPPVLNGASIQPLNAGPVPECLDYSQYQPWVSRIPMGEGVVYVEQIGNMTIVGESTGRLRIFDVSDLENPVSVLDTVGLPITCVAASDTLLFVARYKSVYYPVEIHISEFELYSLTDPTEFRLLQTEELVTPWYGRGALLAARHCHIAEGRMVVITRTSLGKGGLISYEYGEDGLFHRRAGLQTWGGGYSTTIHDGHAYVFKGGNGLVVYDLRQDPFGLVRTIDDEGYGPMYGLVVGDRMFVSGCFGQIGIYDFGRGAGDPDLRNLVKVAGSGGLIALAPDGDLRMGTSAIGYSTIDISNPDLPVAIRNHVLPGGGGDFVVTHEGTTIASTADGVWFLNPTVGDPIVEANVTGWNIRGATVQGGYLYGGEGITFQIHRPEPDGSLDLVGALDLPLPVDTVHTDNRLAVVDTRFWVFGCQVEILDVSKPDSPRRLMALGDTRYSQTDVDAVIMGDTVLVSAGDLSIVDLSDSANPCTIYHDDRIISEIEMIGNVGILQVKSTTTPWTYRLEFADFSDLHAPRELGSFDLPTMIQDLTRLSGNIFVAGAGSRLAIIDLSDLAHPEYVAGPEAGGTITDLFLDGTTLYAATYDGTVIFDMTDDSQPLKIAHLLGTYIPQVSVYQGSIYQEINYHLVTLPAHCQSGLEVAIDVKPGSDTNPINCKHSMRGVVPVAVLTTEDFDATALDHTTVRFGPDDAAEAHSNRRGPIRHESDVDGDGDLDLMFHFRLADTGIQCGDTEASLTGETYDGRAVMGVDFITTAGRQERKPISAREITLAPNPFNPCTMVSFNMEEPGNAKISIFDIRGRRVALLANSHFEPGPQSIEWMGCDSQGRAVPSGSYFFRIEIGGEVQVQKAVLLK
jgi:hypothetical protein